MTAIARLPLLVGLLSCALLTGCGSGSDTLFAGVSEDDLNDFGYTVVDTSPAATPSVSEAEAVEMVKNTAEVIVDAKLLVMRFDRYDEQSENLTWAVQIEPESGHYPGGNIYTQCLVIGAEAAIIFIDGDYSQIQHCYVRPPGGFGPDTPTEGHLRHGCRKSHWVGDAASAMNGTGLQFLEPGAQPPPPVTGPEAVAIITDAGMTSRNVEFGRLIDANADRPLDTIAWAIELYGGVAFVDAETGEILYRLR